MVGLPSRSGTLLPDSVESRAPSLAVPADIGETESLMDETVEHGLIGRGVDAMPRLPGDAIFLPEESSKARRIPRHRHRLPAVVASGIVNVGEIQSCLDLGARSVPGAVGAVPDAMNRRMRLPLSRNWPLTSCRPRRGTPSPIWSACRARQSPRSGEKAGGKCCREG